MTPRLAMMLVLATSSARAEPVRESYRTQTIVVDVAATAAITIGLLEVGKADWRGPVGGTVLAAGIATYFAGGPIVHGVNGNPVLRSIGLRIAPVALGFVVAGLADSCEGGHECAFDGLAEGAASLLVTVPVALAIDWLVFSVR